MRNGIIFQILIFFPLESKWWRFWYFIFWSGGREGEGWSLSSTENQAFPTHIYECIRFFCEGWVIEMIFSQLKDIFSVFPFFLLLTLLVPQNLLRNQNKNTRHKPWESIVSTAALNNNIMGKLLCMFTESFPLVKPSPRPHLMLKVAVLKPVFILLWPRARSLSAPINLL